MSLQIYVSIIGIVLTVLMPATLAECECFNPFHRTLQPELGDPERQCRTVGACFVPCTSSCSDMFRAEDGFKAGRCQSGVACSLVGGTTTLTPIVVDLRGKEISQNCEKGSVCRQTNNINIEVENIQNCGFSNCIQEAGRK